MSKTTTGIVIVFEVPLPKWTTQLQDHNTAKEVNIPFLCQKF